MKQKSKCQKPCQMFIACFIIIALFPSTVVHARPSHWQSTHTRQEQLIIKNTINIPAGASQNISQPCLFLKQLFGDAVVLPTDARYEDEQQLYWASNQINLQPCCRIYPTSTAQAADVVKALRRARTPFAVKSGGHSPIAGASNIAGGATLDLSSLASIVLSPDRNVIEVGSGARWRDVYRILDDKGLYVNGARAGSVGVGGFLLGGGISVAANQHGWSCDSVESVDLITGDGSIITANITHYSNLLASLKGTGNTLGIVTKFQIRTYRSECLEVAFIKYPWAAIDAVVGAFQNANTNAEQDIEASLDLSVGLDQQTGQMIVILMLCRFGDLPSSPVLKPFLEIPSLSRSVQKITPGQLGMDLDLDNPSGFRQHRSTLTVKNDATLILEIVKHFTSLTTEWMYSEDPYYRPGMLTQTLTVPHIRHSAQHGIPNMLGLQALSEPLVLISFEIRWSHSNLDGIYTSLMDSVRKTCEHLGRRKDLLHSFRYPNYASADQDVFDTLRRSGHLDELRKLQSEYDVDDFFTNFMSRTFALPTS